MGMTDAERAVLAKLFPYDRHCVKCKVVESNQVRKWTCSREQGHTGPHIVHGWRAPHTANKMKYDMPTILIMWDND